MLLSDELQLRRSTKIAWQQLEDRVIVVSPEKKLIHIISDSGVDIWEALAKPQTLPGLCQALHERYEVSSGHLKEDVETFCNELIEKEIIIV